MSAKGLPWTGTNSGGKGWCEEMSVSSSTTAEAWTIPSAIRTSSHVCVLGKSRLQSSGNRLIEWFVTWSFESLIDWLIGRSIAWLIGRSVDWLNGLMEWNECWRICMPYLLFLLQGCFALNCAASLSTTSSVSRNIGFTIIGRERVIGRDRLITDWGIGVDYFQKCSSRNWRRSCL